MKNSTIAITTGIAGIIILLTIANFKLSAEYKKGNIISSQTAELLPPFHHIKEIPVKDPNKWGRRITLEQNNDSTAILYNYYSESGLLFSVVNDTLFIEPSLLQKNNGTTITIYYKDLKSVQVSNSSITMRKYHTDSLSIKAIQNSSIRCWSVIPEYLKVEARNEARVTIASMDTVPFANIQLQDNAEFRAEHTIFLQKELNMSMNSSISFLGMSIENFGIKRTIHQ